MTDLEALLRLQTWLSPAFPTGAFSFSSGLESAFHDGFIQDERALHDWIAASLEAGSGHTDAVLLAESWRVFGNDEKSAEIIELATALSLSNLRLQETTALGNAFLDAIQPWHSLSLEKACPLPVAVGFAAAASSIDLKQTLTAFLHAALSNQIQAALRLAIIGQKSAMRVLADFEPQTLQKAQITAQSTLEDLGASTFMADIAMMRHESLESRIFRS